MQREYSVTSDTINARMYDILETRLRFVLDKIQVDI